HGLRRRLVPDALGVHLSHSRPDRWEQHALNLERFAALYPEPAVVRLAELLAADGDQSRYVDSVSGREASRTVRAPGMSSSLQCSYTLPNAQSRNRRPW